MQTGVNRLEDERRTRTDPTRRRIDVTEMDAASVQRYARDRVGTDRVSLEHRGSRTYLVVEE